MADLFIEAVEHLLLIHDQGSPLCAECRRYAINYPKWRRHLATVISEARAPHRKATRRVADVFADHIPYASPNRAGIQCHACLDGRGGGEFSTTEEWAEHLHAELAKAGLKVTNG